MLGIRYHPSSHSSFSPEISGSLSTPQHMNTDWAFFTQPLMRVEWEQNTGSHIVYLFFVLLFMAEQWVNSTLRGINLTALRKKKITVCNH